MQDVPLLAVGVCQERDAGRAVRVIFDRRYFRRNIELVALEIDHPVVALVTAAAPPRCQLTMIVPAAGAAKRLHERLVRLARRDVVERLHVLESTSGRRGLVFSNSHKASL